MDNQTRNGREFELDFDIFDLFIHRFSSYGSEMTYKVQESLPAVPGSLTEHNGSLGHLPGVPRGLPNSARRPKNRVKCLTKRQKIVLGGSMTSHHHV